MHVTKVLIGVLDWGLDAKAAMELPNLFYGKGGVLIENNGAGQAIAAKMKPFGYSFTATSLGSKPNAVERTAGGRSEERRGGKGGVGTGRFGVQREHKKKK